jgi:protein O-mannosyl-transferase
MFDRINSFLADTQNRVSVITLALIVMTLTAYYPMRGSDFVNYDDPAYVYNNHRMPQGLTRANVAWAFQTTEVTNWHPLTWLSHMADCQLFGLNPAGHHATSFLLHLLNVLLLFGLLYRMTGRVWASAFVAAVFAVHPLNVESVAWIAERKNVLSTTFWLLTIGAYVRYARHPKWQSYLPVVGFLILGLLTKPMLVTLPFVLLLLDVWPLRRIGGARAVSSPVQHNGQEEAQETLPAEPSPGLRHTLLWLVLEKVPLFVLAVVSAVITIKASAAGGAMVTTQGLTISNRLANTLVSYATYLANLVLPIRLAAFYPHPGSTIPYWQVLLAGLMLAGITGLIVWRVKAAHYLAVGWLWYLGTLLPVIGLVQVGGQARADRYTYVPMIGVLVIAAWGVAHLTRRLPRRHYWLGGLAVCVLVALTLTTRQQVRYWRNSQALWTRTLNVTAHNYVAHTNLAIVLVAQGKYDEAIEHCNEALRIDPTDSLTYETLGDALAKKGKPEEGIPYLYKALRMTGDKDTAIAAQCALGAAMLKTGNDEKAIHHFSQALRLDPLLSDAHSNLAALLYKSGQYDRAFSHYLTAARIAPDAEHYTKLASALQEQGRLQDAAHFYRKVLSLNPNAVEAQQRLDAILAQSGTNNPTP